MIMKMIKLLKEAFQIVKKRQQEQRQEKEIEKDDEEEENIETEIDEHCIAHERPSTRLKKRQSQELMGDASNESRRSASAAAITVKEEHPPQQKLANARVTPRYNLRSTSAIEVH